MRKILAVHSPVAASQMLVQLWQSNAPRRDDRRHAGRPSEPGTRRRRPLLVTPGNAGRPRRPRRWRRSRPSSGMCRRCGRRNSRSPSSFASGRRCGTRRRRARTRRAGFCFRCPRVGVALERAPVRASPRFGRSPRRARRPRSGCRSRRRRAPARRRRVELHERHRKAMREKGRHAADRAGLALDVVERDVALGRGVEFEDARNGEAFLECSQMSAPRPLPQQSRSRCCARADAAAR